MKTPKWIGPVLLACLLLTMAVTAAADSSGKYLVERESSQAEGEETEEKDEAREPTKERVLPGLSLTEEELLHREIRREYHAVLPKSLDFVIDPFEKMGRGQVYSEPLRFANSGQEPLKIVISGLCASTDGSHTSSKGSGYHILKDSERTIGESGFTVGESEENIDLESLTIGESEMREEQEEPTIGESDTQDKPKEPVIGQSVPYGIRYSGGDASIVFSTEPVTSDRYSNEKDIYLVWRRIDQPAPDIVLSRKDAEPIELILREGEEAIFEITGLVNPSPDSSWMAGDITVEARFEVENLSAETADQLERQKQRLEEEQTEEAPQPRKIIMKQKDKTQE